jgi:hypothetical protein
MAAQGFLGKYQLAIDGHLKFAPGRGYQIQRLDLSLERFIRQKLIDQAHGPWSVVSRAAILNRNL